MQILNLMPVMAAINTRMAPLDWAAIAIYFALLIGVAGLGGQQKQKHRG